MEAAVQQPQKITCCLPLYIAEACNPSTTSGHFAFKPLWWALEAVLSTYPFEIIPAELKLTVLCKKLFGYSQSLIETFINR